ncbi:hypothetical protein C5B90_13005 [Haloferax sp. Atlit-12N]|uniref:DUF5812 family protein n=1 Tax=Haloferax sp. Atlit-12N TaxID=2077203 RepID=UPI000E2321F3|nr:DUF5812 family protein [Haloferax sp. Atlit-12N]RDZ64016.1 hypothetical protein C5B90_13005 [Haloferax sp. Atlit-12N]
MTEPESESESESESERTGTFLVTAADEESAVLKDVHSGQVHALSSNPGVSEDEAVRGTVAPDPPMNVSWQLVEVESRWTVSVERSTESPTTNSRDIAADNPDGELVREERAGTGEIHVLSVPDDMTEQAVDDILSDREGLLSRAARLDVNRVEVRSQPGVVAVRYMP